MERLGAFSLSLSLIELLQKRKIIFNYPLQGGLPLKGLEKTDHNAAASGQLQGDLGLSHSSHWSSRFPRPLMAWAAEIESHGGGS